MTIHQAIANRPRATGTHHVPVAARRSPMANNPPRSARPRIAPRLSLRGYTLIELLVVITVLGIAGALVIPHMVNRDAMNAQAAVRRIIGDLCFAQSDALSHQELRQVHFYADGSGYCVVRITSPSPFSESSSTHDYIIDPLSSAGNNGRYIVNFTADSRFEGVTIADVAIDTNARDLNYDELGGTHSRSEI